MLFAVPLGSTVIGTPRPTMRRATLADGAIATGDHDKIGWLLQGAFPVVFLGGTVAHLVAGPLEAA